ncbi:MAG TPA: hypothetical protein DCE71_03635 [Parachlamydiales bacterium]|nr:hypothetical protein [Parachlamydiales bacterium]
MSALFECCFESCDRAFLDLSSKLTEPFCSTYELLRYRLVEPLDPAKFDNCPMRVQEVGVRILISLSLVLGALLCLAAPVPVLGFIVILAIARTVLRAAGFALQKEGFTHVRGEAREKIVQDSVCKLMTWNVCGVAGGMSLDHGGVVHWRSRLDRIVETIRREGPEVLVLQEIYDAALAEALIKHLKTEYAHFYLHLGPNVVGSVGGCMVLSQCAVHDFSHTSFTNNDWTLNRGFAVLEMKADPRDEQPCARIIGTHLIHGQEPQDRTKRMEQMAQIVNDVASRRFKIPTVLAGDLNIEKGSWEESQTLAFCLEHAYQGEEPTCTNRLVAQWDGIDRPDERIDYISLFKASAGLPVVSEGVVLKDCHLVPAFDASYNTKTALSDHCGLVVSLDLAKSSA